MMLLSKSKKLYTMAINNKLVIVIQCLIIEYNANTDTVVEITLTIYYQYTVFYFCNLYK